MKRSDVFKLALAAAGAFVPGAAPVISGVEHLIHRDDDPSNDLQETATALGDLVERIVAAAEGLTKKDFIDDAALQLLTDHVTADLIFYVQAVHALKPKP